MSDPYATDLNRMLGLAGIPAINEEQQLDESRRDAIHVADNAMLVLDGKPFGDDWWWKFLFNYNGKWIKMQSGSIGSLGRNFGPDIVSQMKEVESKHG